MKHTVKLTQFEARQLTTINQVYMQGGGYAFDFFRLERLFHYLWDLNYYSLHHKILDVGCGAGALENYLYCHGYRNVTAFDITEEGLKRTARENPQYKYTIGDAKELTRYYEGQLFDLIFCLQTLEHIPGHKEVLKEMYKLIVPNGFIMITVPYEYMKHSRNHCNVYNETLWDEICLELFDNLPVVNERITKFNKQMLIIIKKIK